MKTFILLVVYMAFSSGHQHQDTSATGNDCNNCCPAINIHPCSSDGQFQPSTDDGQSGALPRDCTEAWNRGDTSSGQKLISPQDDGASFRVYCDMETDGGGWTVLQRREDGSIDFYRNWNEYKNGFGNTNSEHWLGNAKIQRITAQATYELRVDMADFEGNTSHAKYSKFRLSDASNNYTLILGTYSGGNAGDSLTYQAGYAFSTKDIDHDGDPEHCAQTYQGAWWYNACHYSNLNGLYLKGTHQTYADGVNWKTWKGFNYSLKHVEMKIRAVS